MDSIWINNGEGSTEHTHTYNNIKVDHRSVCCPIFHDYVTVRLYTVYVNCRKRYTLMFGFYRMIELHLVELLNKKLVSSC